MCVIVLVRIVFSPQPELACFPSLIGEGARRWDAGDRELGYAEVEAVRIKHVRGLTVLTAVDGILWKPNIDAVGA